MTADWPIPFLHALPAVTYRIRLPEYQVIFLSEAVRTLFGFDPREWMEEPLRHLDEIHPEDRARARETVRQILAGEQETLEYRLKQRGGAYRNVRHQVRILRNEEGEPVECIGCCLDVTPRNEGGTRGEELVGEVELAMRMVTHDLRAPLRAMSGFAQALQEDFGPQLGERGIEFAGHIVAAARQMDQLTSDLLTYCRVGTSGLSRSHVDLDKVLAKARQRLGTRRDLDLEISVVDPLPTVPGSLEILVEVFWQLLSNAATYVAAEQRPRLVVRSEARGDRWRIWFEDNGIGVPTEAHERIFGLLQRLHGMESHPGSGLGLSIVRRAVRHLGGGCGLESDPGQGSRFWIELPKNAPGA